MAKRSRGVLYLNDMSGGLNNAAPIQDLAENETADCLNVDFARGGAVKIRQGLKMAPTPDGAVQWRLFGAFSTLGNDYALVQSSAGVLRTVSAGLVTSWSATLTDSFADKIQYAPYGGAAYFANCRAAGAIQMKKWDGVTNAYTTLAQVFNDNYLTPNGGDMPQAKLIAAHQGYMWVANTVEGGVANTSRVRFSHPLKPEDWATNDYIDVDPSDPYDEITAIVPFAGSLLVFKRRAIYSIYGSDNTNFVLERIGGAVGAVSQEAIVLTPTVLYWWSTDGNVMAFDGRNITSVGDRIRGPVEDGLISPGAAAVGGWDGESVHFSVPDLAAGGYHFVFNPRLNRGRGSWTRYGWLFGSSTHGRRKNGEAYSYFVTTTDTNRVAWQSPSADGIDDTAVGGTAPIRGYWTSPWLTAGDTATFKRWRRPRLTAFATTPCTLKFSVYHDYDESSTNRQFELALQNTATAVNSLWDSNDWDEMIWSTDTSLIRTFEKLPTLGKCHAVSFRVESLDNNTSWLVESVAIPFEKVSIV